MILIAFLPAVVISFLASRFSGVFSNEQFTSMLPFLPIIAVGLILICLFVSISISMRIYKKKEF